MTAPTCSACVVGDHDGCIDAGMGGVDILDFDPPLCGCDHGEVFLSLVCAEYLHNCPGCSCPCHDDPAARAIWDEAWRRVHMRGDHA